MYIEILCALSGFISRYLNSKFLNQSGRAISVRSVHQDFVCLVRLHLPLPKLEIEISQEELKVYVVYIEILCALSGFISHYLNLKFLNQSGRAKSVRSVH